MEKFVIKQENIRGNHKMIVDNLYKYTEGELSEWADVTDQSASCMNLIINTMAQLYTHEMFDASGRHSLEQMALLLIAGKDISDVQMNMIDQMEEQMITIIRDDAIAARRGLIKTLAKVKEDIPNMPQKEIDIIKESVGDNTGYVIVQKMKLSKLNYPNEGTKT